MGDRINAFRFLWGHLRKGDHFGDPGHGWEDNINGFSKFVTGETWIGLIWFKIVKGGRCFEMR